MICIWFNMMYLWCTVVYLWFTMLPFWFIVMCLRFAMIDLYFTYGLRMQIHLRLTMTCLWFALIRLWFTYGVLWFTVIYLWVTLICIWVALWCTCELLHILCCTWNLQQIILWIVHLWRNGTEIWVAWDAAGPASHLSPAQMQLKSCKSRTYLFHSPRYVQVHWAS